MAFRRRRRKLVTWLPNLERQVGPNDIPVNFIANSIAVDGRGAVTSAAETLVRDQPQADSLELADFTQGGYLLQRIVGKLHIAMLGQSAEGSLYPAYAFVTAGFEVNRVDQQGDLLAGATPDIYGPYTPLNERDPWLWQRSWVVSNGKTTPTVAAGYTDASIAWNGINAPGNQWNGSVQDGPHIDVKVKRRIGPEERLCFWISTWQEDDLGETALPGDVYYILQYRVLATPIRTSNRRNASR